MQAYVPCNQILALFFTFGKALGHGLEVLIPLEGFACVLIDLSKRGHSDDKDLWGRTPVVRWQQFSCLESHGSMIVLDLGLKTFPESAM